MEQGVFPRYAQYRPSGADWLGEIPSDWALKKLKYLASPRNEKSDTRNTELPYIGLENIASWTGKLVESEIEPEGLASLYKDGDVLFGKLRPYLAKVHFAQGAGLCSTEALVLDFREQVSKYFFYLLLSRPFIAFVSSSVYGAKMPRASWDFIGNQKVLLPPVSAQERIANFLDQKTAEIDQAIARKQRLIELLNEQRTILINQAVTRGLNPDIPMRDSGLDWLGTVPAHWLIRRVKYISSFVTSGPRGWAEYYSEDGAYFLQSGNLTDSASIDLRNTNRIKPPSGAEGTRTRLKNNDVLVCITGANTGRVAIAELQKEEVYINQHLCLIRPTVEILPRFLGYYLHSRAGRAYFLLQQYGLKEGLGLNDIKNATIVIPPMEEQKAIAERIDALTLMTDCASASIFQHIEALTEFRSGLIAEAVTGKIKL